MLIILKIRVKFGPKKHFVPNSFVTFFYCRMFVSFDSIYVLCMKGTHTIFMYNSKFNSWQQTPQPWIEKVGGSEKHDQKLMSFFFFFFLFSQVPASPRVRTQFNGCHKYEHEPCVHVSHGSYRSGLMQEQEIIKCLHKHLCQGQ